MNGNHEDYNGKMNGDYRKGSDERNERDEENKKRLLNRVI